MTGRVALVTGAGKGLGRSYALWFARRGATVIVNNRTQANRPSSARAVVEEVRAAGGVAEIDEHDVQSEAGCQAMVQAAVDAFGRLDILVANAGVDDKASYDELSAEVFRRVMDVNFWGTVYPVIAAIPHMVASRYGRIVATLSTAGLFGQPRSAYYGASKSALVGMIRSMALDIPDDMDIRLNMIAPAGFTEKARPYIDPRHEQFMSPDRVAPVVGWLASDLCDRSGLILHAGCGRVRRVQIVGAPPMEIRDDDVACCWPQLDDMRGAEEFAMSFAAGRSMNPEIYD
jgi:NAD(P)-dependent dehydrogenase (short-subunit alcohol dehydrogenase family)